MKHVFFRKGKAFIVRLHGHTKKFPYRSDYDKKLLAVRINFQISVIFRALRGVLKIFRSHTRLPDIIHKHYGIGNAFDFY